MDTLKRHLQRTDCRAQTAVCVSSATDAVDRYERQGGLHVLLLTAQPDPLLRAVATDANIKMGHVAELHMLSGPVLQADEEVIVIGENGRQTLVGGDISAKAIVTACGKCHNTWT